MSRAPRPAAAVKTTNTRRLLIYATLALVVIGVIVAIAIASRVPQVALNPTATAPPLVVGQKAPNFSVATTAGPFALSEVKGKPVFLEVLATWCPHCQRMTSVIDELYRSYGDRVDFVSVTGSQYGVDGSSPASQADTVDFAQRFGVKYPIAYDPDLNVAHSYLQSGFPTLVVIGKDGKIAYVSSGEIPIGELRTALDKALKT